MKVILDSIIYSLQKSGGISVLWTELLQYITKKERLQVTYIEYENAEKNIFYISPPDSFTKIKSKKGTSLERYKNLKFGLREKHVFCSSYYRLSRDKKAVNITIVHDFTYEYFRKGLARKMHSFQKNNALKKADGIICISENTKKDLLKFVPNVNEEKIMVIHNGVSDNFFKIEERISANIINGNLEYLDKKKIILFVGSRVSYKNFDVVVKAVAASENDSFHFVIVGAKLSKKEETFVGKYLKKNQYTVLWALNNEKLNVLYNLSFALVYPSSYEGFGIPVLEAMKVGLPVICLKESSIPEVAGVAGVYIESANSKCIAQKIIELCDEDYRNSIIKKGHSQASKFSWNKTMSKYLTFFEEVYNKTSN